VVSIDRTSKRAYLVVRPAARTPLIEGVARSPHPAAP
jgi:hypothetical protein